MVFFQNVKVWSYLHHCIAFTLLSCRWGDIASSLRWLLTAQENEHNTSTTSTNQWFLNGFGSLFALEAPKGTFLEATDAAGPELQIPEARSLMASDSAANSPGANSTPELGANWTAKAHLAPELGDGSLNCWTKKGFQGGQLVHPTRW